ncbi:MAG: ABC transporter ATP-binding protein [Chloroflexi bacterium]|nr:ABC transporter ATP-binding protein [Chloroflexota bacterium]MCH8116227.1 ABC transporter ATP-binding protein [Chloroflexota bacterium]MCI0775453.1 ABC transporter ATP-binding protein [Chloroflexota bacterium]MCI0803618.1 ABC transporter ATP-binding protein [Chloroflexota bacterium]MCI0807935.1 ABC transporter ATP-binding protein [Chloroflexota bacterium]
MTEAISTAGLTKFYGEHRGVIDVNLEIREGEVFGLLGPNGAGKTTCIRLFLDFIHPTSGSATILGLDSRADSVRIRQDTGYLPGEFVTYEKLTVLDLLTYFANLRGGNLGRAKTLADRFNLDLTRKIGELSRGNRQKVGLVQAFMSDPRLLILDEPTSALDPLLQQEFHRLVLEEAAAGKTLFISSHMLSEVEIICDRVGIIREGSLVTVEEVSALRERALTRVEIEFNDPVSPADFEALEGVTDVVVSDHRLTCSVTGSVDSLIKAAARHTVNRIESAQPGLEEVFLAYYSDETGKESSGAA